MEELSAFDLGWLVGILDGEGYFGYERGTCRVTITMSDEDTINRVAGLFERCLSQQVNIVEENVRSDRPNSSAMYRINLTGDRARRIMRLVVRHMCYRRRQRIWQCLNGYIQPKLKLDIVSLIREVSCPLN